MRFKNLEGKSERESPKRTISASGGLESLQMLSELDSRRCASEKVELQRGWTQGGVPVKTLGPERMWIVRSYIGWGGEQNTLDKDMETSP